MTYLPVVALVLWAAMVAVLGPSDGIQIVGLLVLAAAVFLHTRSAVRWYRR